MSPYCIISATGVRFKLVKSNSCSSRLELVGTGKINSLQQHQQMNQQIRQNMQRDDDKRHSILHRLRQSSAEQTDGHDGKPILVPNEPKSSTDFVSNEFATPQENGSEKCVKQIIERLETTAAAQQSNANGPRIIDSKCVEKGQAEDPCGPSQQKYVGHTGSKQVLLSKNGENQPDLPVVTVNNSISIAGTVAPTGEPAKISIPVKTRTESNYAAVKDVLEQKLKLQQMSAQQQALTTAKPKVVRNRNVDLALSIVSQKTNKSSATTDETSRPHAVQFKDAKVSIKEKETPRPVLTTFSQQHQRLNQQKLKRINSKDRRAKSTPGELTEKNKCETNGEADGNNNNSDDAGQKMIKWGALNAKFDEKFYVTNDTKLKQKKIYDEMEFEEFEVYETVNECYDSLNSNKE